jgi:hypothetical protein
MAVARAGRVGVALVATLAVAVSCAPQGRWAETAPAVKEPYVASTMATVIDCGSATFCVALPGSAAVDNGLAWDGVSWRQFPVPWATGGVDPRIDLGALSCVGGWCLAITDTPGGDLKAWRWDGSLPHWSFVGTLPSSADDTLQGLDCADPGFCMAVGNSVQVWDGTAWASVGDTPAARQRESVQCESRTSCFALAPASGDPLRAQIEHWDGARWTPTASVSRASGSLGALACATDGPCVYAGAQVMSYSGGTWVAAGEIGTLPAHAPHLACAPDDTCVATYGPDTLTFDGARWQRRPGQLIAPRVPRDLACASADVCFATLDGGDDDDETQSLLRWDGSSWMTEAVRSEVRAMRTGFANVSCPADDWCMAIGSYGRTERTWGWEGRGTAQRWNGNSWSTVGDLPWHQVADEAQPLSCSAVDRCLAGDALRSGEDVGTPLLARWDGSRWSDVTDFVSPEPLEGIIDISCSASTCAVVGLTSWSVNIRAVILVSDGAGWTALPPSPATQPFFLLNAQNTRISCATATFCGVSGPSGASIWDGTRWSQPLLWGSYMGQPHAIMPLVGISCPALGTCVVNYNLGTDVGNIATWNGIWWTTERVQGHLYAPVCAAVDRCLTLGSAIGPGRPVRTLAGAYVRNGPTWQPVPTAPAVPPDATLTAASCSRGGCMVVGTATGRAIAYRWSF